MNLAILTANSEKKCG